MVNLIRTTFDIENSRELRAFAQEQKVPGHDQPGRRMISERWVLASHLLALDGGAKANYPIRIAHAPGNESPDFLVSLGSNGSIEGYEVTQATTRKYQGGLKKFERSNAVVRDVAGGRGVAGYQAESYWCRRVLRAVRSKLGKLKQGRYERARAQHLLIYDDMDMVAVDHREALKRLLPRLDKVLRAANPRFDTISIVTTQERVLLDITGSCERLPIVRN